MTDEQWKDMGIPVGLINKIKKKIAQPQQAAQPQPAQPQPAQPKLTLKQQNSVEKNPVASSLP